jgi:hypothetical protein
MYNLLEYLRRYGLHFMQMIFYGTIHASLAIRRKCFRIDSRLGLMFASSLLAGCRVLISTNNIVRGMVRGGRRIRFRPPKIRFLHRTRNSFFIAKG